MSDKLVDTLDQLACGILETALSVHYLTAESYLLQHVDDTVFLLVHLPCESIGLPES